MVSGGFDRFGIVYYIFSDMYYVIKILEEIIENIVFYEKFICINI